MKPKRFDPLQMLSRLFDRNSPKIIKLKRPDLTSEDDDIRTQ